LPCCPGEKIIFFKERLGMDNGKEDTGLAAASRWGPGDQIGAMNEVTSEVVLQAIKLVKKGKVYNLGQTLEMGLPTHPLHLPFVSSLYMTHASSTAAFGAGENNVGGALERVEMCMHSGTHLDAIAHISDGDRMYNGFSSRENTTYRGLKKCGIEVFPPIVTRGVLVNIPAYKGMEMLEGGYVVTPEDIEVAPPEDTKAPLVVHQHLVTENGIGIMENLYLEELAKDRVDLFLFICLPLKLRGASASSVAPVAII
jgi:kynurenine formamidase